MLNYVCSSIVRIARIKPSMVSFQKRSFNLICRFDCVVYLKLCKIAFTLNLAPLMTSAYAHLLFKRTKCVKSYLFFYQDILIWTLTLIRFHKNIVRLKNLASETKIEFLMFYNQQRSLRFWLKSIEFFYLLKIGWIKRQLATLIPWAVHFTKIDCFER